jgi:hypothetical protein
VTRHRFGSTLFSKDALPSGAGHHTPKFSRLDRYEDLVALHGGKVTLTSRQLCSIDLETE